MRELKYFVACTVDGFIAREDGSFDFFPARGDHLDDIVARFPDTIPGHLRAALGVSGGNRSFDAVLMGRGTYEVGLKMGVTRPYGHLKQYVFSRTLAESPDASVELVRGHPAPFVRGLKAQRGMDIWLCGGGELAAALIDQIDELILKVNPIVLGSGIGLFRGAPAPTRLRLIDSRPYRSGVVMVSYRMRPEDGAMPSGTAVKVEPSA
jgi:dihydrofolate reductase